MTTRAFRSLLGARRCFSADETLEATPADSAMHQEVTEQLGLQVRRAVAVLIQSLDRADQDLGRKLLGDVSEAVLYEAALTVMMRLVFLFYAEENKLIPAQTDDALYWQIYAVSTILDRLQGAADQHGEEVLERRFDAWARLLAAFRAVFGGVRHERRKLPAYGGNLFNPDRFPFLEGRKPETTWRSTPAAPLPVNDRTVLHLLRSLQYLQGERKEDFAVRLSFRSLGVEQIGRIYEGLLDHTAKRAAEPMLGLLAAKGKETEVSLAELERRTIKGEADRIAFLKEQTGRQEKALRRGLDAPLEGEEAKKLRAACGNDTSFLRRVFPFSGLLRNDTFGRPVVIPTGSAFVTAGTDRRSSGAHYTPRSLTEPIVRYTLEPLVYVGPDEGLSKGEWKLRSAKELLDLKICDMACGAGAFLVQACRYLAERLLQAWDEEEGSHRGTEQLVFAMRLVAQRCLYGVDKNSLAVEMAKLSLWLLTTARDLPFTFLDHAVRCGDSLVGLRDLKQLQHFNLDGEGASNSLFLDFLRQRIPEALDLRRRIETTPEDTVGGIERSRGGATPPLLLAQAKDKLERLKLAADLLVAAELRPGAVGERKAARNSAAVTIALHFHDTDLSAFRHEARKALVGQTTFHWPLEFPEVIVDRGGFDAFVCNPPFINAIDGDASEGMKTWLRSRYKQLMGTADLSYYFVARINESARPRGTAGLILPRAFLNAPSAKKLRANLLAARSPAMIYCPDGVKRFHAANVRIAAVSLGGCRDCQGGKEFPLHGIIVRSENWWEPFAVASGNGRGAVTTLGRRFEIMGSMTTGMAYELLPFVIDEREGSNPRFVTTGLIDPGVCLWGRVNCKYLKRTFSAPRIAVTDDLPSAVRKRLSVIRRPKVLIAGVAGPGTRIEAFVDRDGGFCGAVSTFTVFDRDDNLSRLDRLCTVLNSDAAARRVAERLGAAAMGSGLLTITKDFLYSLPLHEGERS